MSGCLRVTNRESEADMLEPIEIEMEIPVRRRTVQERIRLGKKNEGCRAQGENAAEPANLQSSRRKVRDPKAKTEHRPQASPERATKRAPRVKHLAIARKPSTCSIRGFGSRDHMALSRSIACSADPASWPTCSRRTAKTVSPLRPAR